MKPCWRPWGLLFVHCPFLWSKPLRLWICFSFFPQLDSFHVPSLVRKACPSLAGSYCPPPSQIKCSFSREGPSWFLGKTASHCCLLRSSSCFSFLRRHPSVLVIPYLSQPLHCKLCQWGYVCLFVGCH
jgi:hypothetical protein